MKSKPCCFFAICGVLVFLGGMAISGFGQTKDPQLLLTAAGKGDARSISELLAGGASVNVEDSNGNTALHLAVANAHQASAEILIRNGALINTTNHSGFTPLDVALARGHSGMAAFLRTQGALRSGSSTGGRNMSGSAQAGAGERSFNPDAPYQDAESFSKAIGVPAVMLTSSNVAILAPKTRERAGAIVLPYLARAYDELYKLVGVHTKYRILVYAYPKGTPGVRGGTSGCMIRYTDENLELEAQPEWKEHRVPHLSGYIEEMAHNFVHATGAEFGWEMIGWTIAARVTEVVAPNPIHRQQVLETQRNQDRTYHDYIAGNQTFPGDLPGDQADRIHAYVLRKSEQLYGPKFWPDFFAEVRKEKAAFAAADLDGGSEVLDRRYRLTVECFDRLAEVRFKNLLEQNGISTTVAIQSLKPTQPGWNRKLK